MLAASKKYQEADHKTIVMMTMIVKGEEIKNLINMLMSDAGVAVKKKMEVLRFFITYGEGINLRSLLNNFVPSLVSLVIVSIKILKNPSATRTVEEEKILKEHGEILTLSCKILIRLLTHSG